MARNLLLARHVRRVIPFSGKEMSRRTRAEHAEFADEMGLVGVPVSKREGGPGEGRPHHRLQPDMESSEPKPWRRGGTISGAVTIVIVVLCLPMIHGFHCTSGPSRHWTPRCDSDCYGVHWPAGRALCL